MDSDLVHATLKFERHVPADPEAVFQAFADVRLRAEWGAPSESAAIAFDQSDFRVGGMDLFRCGPRLDPHFHGMTSYLDIEANRRIVSSEVIESGGRRLCASLTTVEFSPGPNGGTDLVSTTQLVSFLGRDMVEGHEAGNNGSLDSLVSYFSEDAEKA